MSIKKMSRNGYVMLVTVLAIGMVASASAIAVLTLGLGIERNAFSMQLSSQAMAGAHTCAERALLKLQEDLKYRGNEPLNVRVAYADGDETEYENQTCYVYPIGGDGNNDRVLCTEASYGDFTKRRLYIKINQILPSTTIDTWQEVANFPVDCGTYTGDIGAASCGDGTEQTGTAFCYLGAQHGAMDCDGDPGMCEDTCNLVTNRCNTNAAVSCTSDADCTGTCVESNEDCDDGNTVDGDGCSATCKNEICGDRIVQPSEQCDDGGRCDGGPQELCLTDSDCSDGLCIGPSSDDGSYCYGGDNDRFPCTSDANCPGGICNPACNELCVIEFCGDGVYNDLSEQCDEGASNNDYGEICTTFCRSTHCGDSIIQPMNNNSQAEQCDNGGFCTNGGAACADDSACGTVAASCEPGRCSLAGVLGNGCSAFYPCGGGATCIVPASDSCDNACQIISDPVSIPWDTVLHWSFNNEGSGSEALDEGSNPSMKGNLRPSGSLPTWTAGYLGDGITFDGVNDRIEGPSGSALFTDEFTVSFWVDRSGTYPSTSWSDSGILCKVNGSDWSRGWGLYFKPQNENFYFPSWTGQKRIHFFVEDSIHNVASAPVSDETQWNHIAGVYDGTNILLYVNGIATANTDTFTGFKNRNYPFEAGRCGTNTYALPGKLDEIRFYDYALSSEQIQGLYLE